MIYHFNSINQSLIKKVVSKRYDPEINFYQEIPHCPKRLYYEYISKEIKSVPTEAQMKGLIFENMLLGGNAHGANYTDIPKLSNGKYPVSYQRLLRQVENAKIFLLQNNIIIYKDINCQIPLAIYDDNLDITITCELDVFPTTILHEGNVKNTILDLKFTGNVYSDFSEYGWGNTANMDFIQADIYTYIVKTIFYEERFEECKALIPNFNYKNVFTMKNISSIQKDGILFHYLVFGNTDNEKYPLDEQKRMFERVYTKEKEYEALARLAYAVERLREDERKGWLSNPDQDLCKDCPVKDIICNDYPKVNKI